MPNLKNPCGQNPLRLAGSDLRARTCTPNNQTQGIKTAARDVVSDKEDATICRDSRARVRSGLPHVPQYAHFTETLVPAGFLLRPTGIVRAGFGLQSVLAEMLTPIAVGIECLYVPP